MKVIQFNNKGKRVARWIIIRIGFFNPFKKQDPSVIIPTFNITPQLGIRFGRTTEVNRIRFIGFVLGLFNFLFEVNVHSFKIERYIRR